VSVSCVEQFGVQEFGEKAAETPCGSPETEKLIERFLEATKVALIVVVADDPGVIVTAPVLESDKPEVCVDVDAEVRTVSEADKSVEEVSAFRLATAGIAFR
jgi:hypothetical protein